MDAVTHMMDRMYDSNGSTLNFNSLLSGMDSESRVCDRDRERDLGDEGGKN